MDVEIGREFARIASTAIASTCRTGAPRAAPCPDRYTLPRPEIGLTGLNAALTRTGYGTGLAVGDAVKLELSKPASSVETATLPEDLLREQLLRVQLLYAAGAILWSITFALDVDLSPNGDRGPYRLLIEGLAVALAVATIGYVRFARGSDRAKIAVGSVMVIAHALVIALLNSWAPQPTTSRPLSGISLLILLYGMIAPATPRRTFVVSMIAASMDPLGVWIAHLRGLPVPPPLNTFAMFYLNYACASLAVVPASIVYRLGREIREARALGSYQLVAPLGSGGMGEVWIGRHRLLARTAAIKLIRADMSSETGDRALNSLRRFELEAQATAALTSPHTIRVFDFGLTRDGTFYYVMELLDGRDLESLVREFGPLPPSRVLHLAKQICSSLAEAHEIGLIHRDVKPANIFACRMGLEYDFVKVLDFGIVKHEHRPTAPTLLTSGLVTMGTPAYMAPEVILREEELDRRVDIYALGCVIYFLLTGEHVFNAPSPMKVMMQHVTVTPQPPSARSPYPVPRALDLLVMACLSKNPDRRPSTMADVLRLLTDCEKETAWNQAAARVWWEMNLPQLSQPRRTLSQSHASASGYTAGGALTPAPLRPSIY
jgi:serine/threonine protein kinase